MSDELSSLTSEDLQVQLNQLRKAEAEDKARELFKQELSFDISYQLLIEKGEEEGPFKGITGFMHIYVMAAVDLDTITTTAKRDVVLSLAKSDLLRDLAFISFSCSDSKPLVITYKLPNCRLSCFKSWVFYTRL